MEVYWDSDGLMIYYKFEDEIDKLEEGCVEED